ncbi:MAG: hypothetical protein ABIK28_09320 [Planctomycetota bacterium]
MRRCILFTSMLLGCVCLITGCSTPRGCFLNGFETARQFEQPDSDDVQCAFEDLNESISLARRRLQEDEDARTACRHDQTAYLIPLSRLMKARLYGRFNQIPQQEEECWSAIRDAESCLGRHIQSLAGGRINVPFACYSVFFRREKIRRHAFTLLKESYRKAGEKDLESLMKAQIGFSDIYLRSPVAHSEEQYIRTAENSDWVRLYDLDKAEIGHSFSMIMMSFMMAAAQAGAQMQRSQLESQAAMTNDPALRANLNQQIATLDMQMQQNMQQMMDTMQKMEENHQANLNSIQQRHQNTVLGALMANFTTLDLSDEVRSLSEYRDLRVKKEIFDRYVQSQGFDANAAQALAEVRTSLDNLTMALQRRRQS